MLRQSGVIYGGLIAIAVVMVQGFLEARSLDASARVSTIAFAVAIPLLAALVLVNRQEAFRGRRTTSVSVTLAQAIAQLAAFVGIVAGFWDITWVAGVTFLVSGHRCRRGSLGRLLARGEPAPAGDHRVIERDAAVVRSSRSRLAPGLSRLHAPAARARSRALRP